MSSRQFSRALPKNVHVLPLRSRAVRLCGATTGAFIRARDEAYLAKFLRDGGGLCPECARALRAQGAA